MPACGLGGRGVGDGMPLGFGTNNGPIRLDHERVAMGVWLDRVGRIDSFPFLREVGPVLAQQLPDQWRRWCGGGPNPYLDAIAAGPLLSPEEILAAVRGSRPAQPKPVEAAVAEEESDGATAA
jgi:hypothetical protein